MILAAFVKQNPSKSVMPGCDDHRAMPRKKQKVVILQEHESAGKVWKSMEMSGKALKKEEFGGVYVSDSPIRLW